MFCVLPDANSTASSQIDAEELKPITSPSTDTEGINPTQPNTEEELPKEAASVSS
jgi:hypothetical protein